MLTEQYFIKTEFKYDQFKYDQQKFPIRKNRDYDSQYTETYIIRKFMNYLTKSPSQLHTMKDTIKQDML